MDGMKILISRIGTFCLLVGTGLVFLFIMSDVAKQPNFTFFVFGIILWVAAWYFKRISAPPPKPPSTRFEWLRKLRQKQKEAQAKKDAAKKGPPGQKK